MLSVLIVGCGNIAGGFDRGRPHGEWPVTHAGAYRRDGRFRLAACVEPDTARREDFMTSWSIGEGYASMTELVDRGMAFDVVSICSPTLYHGDNLETALALMPTAVLCEKPITPSLGESERLVRRYAEAGVALGINYNRRWDPAIIQLRKEIADGAWGALRSATAVYNKGVLNNGSHMLDLLAHLFGSLELIAAGPSVHDFFDDDPTVPAWLAERTGAPIYLTCGHAADYSLFELRLVFSEGTVSIENGGERWRVRHVVASERFAGYRVLDDGEFRRGGDEQTMSLTIDNLYRTVTLNEPLASSGATALAAQRLSDQIRGLSGRAIAGRAVEMERAAE